MILVFLGLYVFIFALYQFRKIWQLPPGPIPFHILGNIPQLTYGTIFKRQEIVKVLQGFERNYGKVFTIWMGPIPTVHIGDYDIAVEQLVKQAANTLERPASYIFTAPRTNPHDGLTYGTVFSNGRVWREHRRFQLTTLKNLGFGKNAIQQLILDESDFVFESATRKMVAGKVTLNAPEFFDFLIGSIINRVLFGYRFDEENRELFFSVKRPLDDLFTQVSFFDNLLQSWCSMVPYLKELSELVKPQENVMHYAKKNVDRRKAEIASGEHVLEGDGTDFIDAYLIRQQRADGGELFDDHGLYADLFDLWMAGQETVTITISWAFIYLLKHPDVVKKIRAEVEEVTHKARPLLLEDAPRTPYLKATILEVQRLSRIISLTLWRSNKESTYFGSYRIPAGTTFAAQTSLIMNDPDYFENPDEFNPDRYMGPNGKELGEKVIPFLVGKRNCIGESLARNELYLIIGNLLQRFNVDVDPKMPPVEEPQTSFNSLMHRSKEFNFVLSERLE